MNARNDEPRSGFVNQETLQKAIRDNISPEAVATIIALLRTTTYCRPPGDTAMRALREVEWFADTLTEMLGVEEHNRLMEELGL